MNLNPKYLGDEFSLDEYNACQYLLYSMNCWNDSIILDTYYSYVGTYSSYKLKETSLLTTEKRENYRLAQATTSQNNTLEIYLENIKSHFGNLNLTTSITINYLKPRTYVDADGSSWSPDTTNELEIYEWSTSESKIESLPSINNTNQENYEKVEVEGTYDKKTRKIQFKLPEGLPKDTLLSKHIVINYKLDKEPYIDFRNGQANELEEILVDNVDDLEKLIANVPRNNKMFVFRLDSNIDNVTPKNAVYTEKIGTYFLNKPLTIHEGQNIVVRGGTNARARLNGSVSKRIFVVKPGGSLTISNLIFEYCNCNFSEYDAGRGGAILLEGNYSKFGTLDCTHCTFVHNSANWGGAIFSYHAGLYVQNCYFDTNNSMFGGGAIYYQAQDVKLKVANIVSKVGVSVTIYAEVTKITGVAANEGKVEFFIRKNNVDTSIGEARVRNGKAEITYTIPSETKTVEYPLIAIYSGGKSMDNETGVGSLKIKVPENYTLSWITDNPTKAKVGETIHLNVKAVDIKGNTVTEPTILFKIGTESYYATQNGNLYELIYTIKESDITDKTKNTFPITCTAVKSDDYICNTIKTTFTVDMEKETNTVTGYVTGLYVNSHNIDLAEANVKTKLETWKSKGITDVYVRYINHNSASHRETLEAILNAKKKYNITGIRVHATINVCYDASNSKWYLPTENSRITFIKSLIDYIATNIEVDGINIDYCRYSGADGTSNNETKQKNITALYKTLNEYIKSKNKNYIISTSIKAEDEASYTYYGQNHKNIEPYVDYMQPMVYKGDYKKDDDDTWVENRVKYLLNTAKVSKDKLIISLQTYKSNGTTELTYDSLTETARKVAAYKVKGIVLFREGKVNSNYVKSYHDIMEGN